MPRKIRELMKELEKVGFVNRGGRGSHRNYIFKDSVRVTISGKSGDDAKKYQEKAVKKATEEVTDETGE